MTKLWCKKRIRPQTWSRQSQSERVKPFQNYRVYKTVPDTGQIRTDWVVTPKIIDGKPDVKTRLICRGNEAKLQDSTQRIDSPTVKRPSVKIMMCLATQHKWQVKCQDVTSAFLQAKKLERDIFVQPPPECGYTEPTLWKLLRPMYGLDEASFLWYETVKDFLEEKGCKRPTSDPAFFYWHKDGKLEEILATWVDDTGCPKKNASMFKRP